jgi:hypothetical protein
MRPPTGTPPLLAAFLAAHYRVFLPQGELRLVPGRAFAGPIAAPGTPWALLTAFNPGARTRDESANDAAQARLVARLHAARHACWAGINSDAQGGHAERSVLALGIRVDEADALAREFGQCALLAGVVGGTTRLRILREHWPATVVDSDFVDWVASPAPDDRRA